MIVNLSPPGIKCQVGDFVMIVETSADSDSGAKAGRPQRADLILRTKTNLPIEFPLPPEIVAGAGEYEISGVRVKGISLDGETNGQLLRTVYSAELEGIRLSFLGELSGDAISQALGKLGAVDILFLSVEPGKLKGKQIATLVKQLDPKMIIPVGDKTVKLLAEELGQKIEAHEKIVIKKKDLDKEQVTNKLVWLKSAAK
ncbi:MAG: MBL fold metallo-hydrolase [bacterium]|nr:MBL fold metallo-hydrolase [bacterium]